MKKLPRPQARGENEVGSPLYDGRHIRLWRVAQGVSLAELAKVMRLSTQNLGAHERPGLTGRHMKSLRAYFEGVEKTAQKLVDRRERALAEYLRIIEKETTGCRTRA